MQTPRALGRHMMPWPVAALSVVFGLVATVSAATLWKIAAGVSDRAAAWPVVWVMLSGVAMFGLALLKPWGRGLAIVVLALMMTVILAVAVLHALAGQGQGALVATVCAGGPVLAIRYLRRPMIKTFFSDAVKGEG